MSAPVSYGFLRPQASRVAAGPWRVVSAGSAEADDPVFLADWDYNTNLTINRSLDVDVTGLLQDCGLTGDSDIIALITWHATGTGIRGTSEPTRLADGTTSLPLELPGELLGGRLNLETRIVACNPLGEHPLRPKRKGSTLWNDVTRIALEGAGMRFPVMPVPFDKTGIAGGRKGAWALEIETADLSASGAGSMRLFLNSSHPAVQQLLEAPENPLAQRLQQFIHYDIARQIIVRALQHEDLDESQPYEAGTLGELMLTLIGRLFPDRAIPSLRGDYRTSPGELEAELQARLGLMI